MKSKRAIVVTRTAMIKGLAAFLMALALVFGFASCKTESEEETVYRTVTYSTEHAIAPEKLTVTDGTALTAEQLPALTADGYTFGGWYDGDTKAEAGQYRVTKNVTLTAKWTAVSTSESDSQNPDTPTTPDDSGNTGDTTTCTVTFTTNGGTAVTSQKIESGKTATEPTAPTKDGYAFAGWFTDSGLTAAFTFNTAITADITLYAKWTAVNTGGSDPQNPDTPTTPDDGGNTGETTTYTVTVESGIANGKVIASPTTAAAGTEITLTVTPSTGYQLTTLTVTDADSKEVTVTDNKFTMPESNVTVSATFTALPPESASYTVKHLQQNIADDSYTLKESETKTGTVGEATSASAKSYDGFTAQDFSQATIAASGTEVEIKYKRKAYTVTFNSDGGSDVPSQTVRYEATATKPADPTKTGYTFDGWYINATKFEFTTAIAENITLTAKWTPATNTAYKVLHYKQNAENDEYTLSDTENLTGTTGEQTTAEAKTYNHFTAGTVTQAAIAADGSTEIKIYYTRETVTFTIDFAGGKLGEQTGTVTKTGKYGQSISVADPTRSGYTFSGWNTTGGKIPATFETSATYTALWTSASGITVTIAPVSTIGVAKTVSDDCSTITLTADSGFIGYTWLIDGTAASGVTGATVSGDGTRLTLAKANLTANAVYQVSLSATKDGIPYGAQISVKKEPAGN